MIEITSPKSSYVKPYLSESYTLNWTLGSDEPNITPAQTAFEVLYREKGMSIWNTCGKTESDLSSFDLSTIAYARMSDRYFVEIEYKLHVWMCWTKSGGGDISGDAYSNIYEFIACPSSAIGGEYVGVYDGVRTQRYPVFDDLGTAGIESVQINAGNDTIKKLPIVDENHPLAGNLKIKTNDGVKAAAAESAKFSDVAETRNGSFTLKYSYGYYSTESRYMYYGGYIGASDAETYFDPPFAAYGYVSGYSYEIPGGMGGGAGTVWSSDSNCNYFYSIPKLYAAGSNPSGSYSHSYYPDIYAMLPKQYQHPIPASGYAIQQAYAYGYYLQYSSQIQYEPAYTPTYTPPTYTPSSDTYGYYSYISGYYSYGYQSWGGAGIYTYYTTSPVYGAYLTGSTPVYGSKTGYGTYSYYARYRTTSYNATGYGTTQFYGYYQNGYNLGYYTYGYGTSMHYGTYGIPKYEKYSGYRYYSYTYTEWNHAYDASGYYSYTYSAITGYSNTYGYKVTGYTSNGPLTGGTGTYTYYTVGYAPVYSYGTYKVS